MPNLFPYTNTHELNLDWILQVVKDFQSKYSTIEQGIDDALADIEEAKNGSLEEMQSALETAINAIDAAYQQASTGINQARNSAITAIQQQRLDALSSINTDKNNALSAINTDKNNALLDLQTALTTALASIATQQTNATHIIEQLYNTLPASAQDILGRLNILDNIITGYTPSNAFQWLQGGYIYPEGVTPPTPPAINTDDPAYDKIVSSLYMTGCAGQRLRISTDGTIHINLICCWFNTPPGGAPGGFSIGQEGLTPTFGDIIFPLNTTAFSIELVSPTGETSITPADVIGHIDVRWVTDFVDQATIAPKENSNTANVARETGELFFLDGVLYRALDDIAVGDTIVTSGAGANCQETSISSEIASIEGGGGGGGITGVEIVNTISNLAATTANKVLVLNDNSEWGTGGPCWFEKNNDWSTHTYERINGTYVSPIPNQSAMPEANAPWEQLLNIMHTWVGNLNLHHGDKTQFDNDLFGPRCEKDSSNLFCMDCSAFVCAVLLGITYDNSRYVLGANADNIEKQYLSNHIGPSKSSLMPKGGLQTFELAMWFAQHGRLFDIPQSEDKVRDTLKFGDILFGSNSENKPDSYYNIEHCMFVLGTTKNYIVVAESSSAGTLFEPQGIKIAFLNIPNTLTNTYLRVFARPNYQNYIPGQPYMPYANGYILKAFLLPIAQIRRLTDHSTGTSVNYGELYSDSWSMATPDYIPIIEGSTVEYIGDQQNSTNVYYNWRLHEYDETMTIIKSTTLAYYNTNGSAYVNTPVTLTANTKYVRFSENHYQNTQTARLAETKAFKFKVTPPNPI